MKRKIVPADIFVQPPKLLSASLNAGMIRLYLLNNLQKLKCATQQAMPVLTGRWAHDKLKIFHSHIRAGHKILQPGT